MSLQDCGQCENWIGIPDFYNPHCVMHVNVVPYPPFGRVALACNTGYVLNKNSVCVKK
jgi:hypothetical protein